MAFADGAIIDVLVLGGGNAALCAALSARELGARVLVVEAAPVAFRGGNSRHTRNLRAMHDASTDVLSGAYTEEEYWEDLRRVTGGKTDEELARLAIRSTGECMAWMRRYGVRFQPALRGTLQLGRTNAFFLGGGKALMNTYYAAAERAGIEVLYEAEVVDLDLHGGEFHCATVHAAGRSLELRAKAVVVAAGGFEANLEWLREAWGEAAANFIVRGSPYNRGKVLQCMLAQGVQPVGDATQCHAVAIDARAPKFDGGIVTRVDCVSLGIVVNREAVRFYDEGEDFWPKRYAIWGRLVARQPSQIAYAIIDSKAAGQFLPSAFPPVRADSIDDLARRLELPAERLRATVDDFNRALVPGTFNHQVLDDCRTHDISPPKSHWARPIDRPPYYGYPLRPGITFTYLGVKVDRKAQVYLKNGRSMTNVFAAGEIMAGNILGQGYLGGIGMLIGTVFGRIAGREAAALVAR